VQYVQVHVEAGNLRAISPVELVGRPTGMKELAIENPDEFVTSVRHAGAIFLGTSTPEAVGDYIAGPNHTLPTSGAARYASALGVETFMKHSSLIQYSSTALNKMAGAIQALAQAEGLPSHEDSVRLRTFGERHSD